MKSLKTRSIELKQVCPICQSTPHAGPVYHGVWKMAWCPSCEIQFLREGPEGISLDLEAIHDKYRNEGYAKDYLPPDSAYRREVKGFFGALDLFRERGFRSPVFCDIGCSVGIALGEAKRRGYRPLGVELSETAAEVARESVGCEIWAEDIFELDIGKIYPVDVLYLNHILEHFPDPIGTLGHLKQMAAVGSLLWINVPNVYSVQRSVLAKLGKTRGLGLGEHFCYFSWKSLYKLMEVVGYKVIWRKGIYFNWHWKFLPLQVAARLLRVPDAISLIARRIQ